MLTWNLLNKIKIEKGIRMWIEKLLFTIFVSAILLTNSSTGQNFKKISVKEYNAKVYASWLGQCVGNIYGLPHENAYIDSAGPESFPYGYGRNAELLRKYNGAFSDDDTDIEYMYLLAMEKYGIEPKLEELAELWKYHVRDRVWLANRAALAAMHYGFTPPVTGWKLINPHWFQIDPQLINEIWAVTSPGMISYSTEKSGWAGTIMDDGWGVEPTVFYGALYAAAFFETDVDKLIDIGLKSLPEGSRYKTTVQDMIKLHEKYPEDWEKARSEMAEKYYINEPIDTKTIWNANLNGACGVLALLYGNGDFQKTLDLACAMGFDADNQAATLSGLIGIMHGVEGIPKELLYPFEDLKWELPLNDLYKNITRYDMPDGKLTDMANRIAAQGEQIILKYGGKKVTENNVDYYLINADAEFNAPFELPKGPLPVIELNKNINYKFIVSGGTGKYKWQIIEGNLPEGLKFENGYLTGKTSKIGIYSLSLEVSDGNESLVGKYNLIARGNNLAESATEVLANVKETEVKLRDSFWLTVPYSLYANKVEDIIRDGKYLGDGSTFYSLNSDLNKKTDYYGYRWENSVNVGVISLHTGSVEEMGGWFNSLEVEYLDQNGEWTKADDVNVTPKLPAPELQFIRPNFVEYLLTFKPVSTKAVRIKGESGGLKHWRSDKIYHFTSITELSVYESIPGL